MLEPQDDDDFLAFLVLLPGYFLVVSMYGEADTKAGSDSHTERKKREYYGAVKDRF